MEINYTDYDKKMKKLKGYFKGSLKDNSIEFIKDLLWIVDMGNDIHFDPNKRDKPTIRQEANVITAYSFRNTILEDIHANAVSFNDDTMRKLMIESSWRLSEWLAMRDTYTNELKNSSGFIIHS
jgi:hypothetical protein